MSVPLLLYSDFVCPFCFIAERSSLVRLQEEFDIVVDWRGFELHPETPQGGMPVTALVPRSRRETMRDYLRGFAARFGVNLMETPERLPNTRRALAMAEYARDRGRLEAFRDAAMEGYWRRGENLEDDRDLHAISSRAGLDAEAALRAAADTAYAARVDAIRAEASGKGVTGIPTFFIGEEVVVGCQPYEVLATAARRASAPSRA